MPRKPPRVCPRCGTLITGRRCPKCYPTAWTGSHSPYSTRRWRKLRKLKLDNNPWCEWPGCGRPATEVDHKQRLAIAPHRRYDYDNLQSLCSDHHTEKTKLDARRGRGLADPDDDDDFDSGWDSLPRN